MLDRRLRRVVWAIAGSLAIAALACGTTHAQDAATSPPTEINVVEPEGDSATGQIPQVPIDTGDHAWMLVSTALVLMMTGPGLALFYCGLVRKKNVVGVLMQCTFLMALMSVIWALYGYSLSFGGSDPRWGSGEFLFMQNVSPVWDESAGEPRVPMEGTIPRLTHMLFQGMFFVITPALICGALAERMKFSTLVVFMILWGTFVYCPLCHWVWDGGILAMANPQAWFGALDFAGGTVVHISSGVSALVCALVLGRRLGFGSDPMPPHNLTYTAIGAAMLWVGWFGFNAGSALGAGASAASAFAATHFAAAAGGLGWAALEWLLRGKPSLLGTCSGAVAGLVCITPAAGYVQPMPALVFGLAAAGGCFLACTKLKSALRYDDALDAFGVHGVGGTIGSILTGVFATQAVAPAMLDGTRPRLGLLENGTLLGAQIGATALTWVYAGVVTFVILKVLDVTMGLRVSQQQEIQGLDLSQHGEEGYIFL